MTAGAAAVGAAVVHEVPRRRLMGVLDQQSAGVVVVSAPAGSGKSILARQWTAGDARAGAELRLAAHLDGPVALSRALIDALETVGPPAPDARARLSAKEPAFSAALLPALAHLMRTRGAPFVLVVDDVHLISTRQAHEVLATVCDAVPEGSSLVLLTRSQTPPWLARLRTTGRLVELTGADLAFDPQEAHEVLSGMGLTPGPDDVQRILEHTEGWAVGVYLTALSLHATDRPGLGDVRLAQGSDRAVADYLRTQVLDPLPDDHRRFLTRSSVLDELTAPRCDAVLARSDSAAVLADLHRHVQLVLAVNGDETRYRCHHLLAEELALDLRTDEPAQLPELHARACAWFDAHGDRDAAVRHAIASGDSALVERTIWPAVPGCVASGDLDRLRAWLGGLDDQQIADRRWLTMAAAWASLQQGDAVAMRRWAGLAERHAGQDWREQAPHDQYAATLAVLHGLVGSGGLEDTRDLCDRALGGLPPDDPFRAPAAFNTGVAQTLLRDVAAGISALTEAAAFAEAFGIPVIEANAKSWLGVLALGDGERERGVRLVSEAAEVVRRHRIDRLATGAVSVTAEAYVLALLGDKSAASLSLATARRLTGIAEAVGPWFAVSGRVLQARTALLLGDGATARLLLGEARRRLTPALADSLVGDGLTQTESLVSQASHRGGTAGVLTSTEMRILQFLPSHLTLKQIGEHLFVSQSTVKTHVLSIYRKFGVGSRDDAVAHARALGLVEVPLGE